MRSDRLPCLLQWLRQFTRRRKAHGIGFARCFLRSTPHLCHLSRGWSRGWSGIYIYTNHVAAPRRLLPQSGGVPSSKFVLCSKEYRPLETLLRGFDTVFSCHLPRVMSDSDLNGFVDVVFGRRQRHMDGFNDRGNILQNGDWPSPECLLATVQKHWSSSRSNLVTSEHGDQEIALS
jgi:hypothetical protein